MIARLKVKGALVEARRRVEKRWDVEGGDSVVSGKAVLNGLKTWANNVWGVSFSSIAVATEVQRDELADEIKTVFDAFERKARFPKGLRMPVG